MKPPSLNYTVLLFLPALPKQCKHVLPLVAHTERAHALTDEPLLQDEDALNLIRGARYLDWFPLAETFPGTPGS
jgi:hypothetical protein